MAELDDILRMRLSEFNDYKKLLADAQSRIDTLVATDEANNKQQLNEIENLKKKYSNLENYNRDLSNNTKQQINELEKKLSISKR